VFRTPNIVKLTICKGISGIKLISAWEKNLEAGDCLVSIFQEIRADPGKVGRFRWSVSDRLSHWYNFKVEVDKKNGICRCVLLLTRFFSIKF
jgi:hypothetical protein